MPKSCAARQCCNRYSSRRKQLTFHRFPFSRPELLKAWVLNMGRAGFKPKQHTVICSEHFRPECFSAFGNRKNLKHNAVPTVFAFREPAQVHPEAGAGGDSPAWSADSDREELQQPPRTKGLVTQALPPRPEAAGDAGAAASQPGPRRPLPGQPSDHSYALLDLAALKRKLFLTLRENEQLRKRLKSQRLVLRRMCSLLRARRVGCQGARPRPEPQS
ncbi:THAP domain-containing protein 3 isoform X2 [Octodon degus]|uniref:THAP domain-containing protein 3 isoform X2 n=1 Tax=Octodon degus TaxID=10160 RepID=A0A6P3FKQ4_OCTDE|nr:THAP domain-containing protein 3 isoform X2 [Octodon degus]